MKITQLIFAILFCTTLPIQAQQAYSSSLEEAYAYQTIPSYTEEDVKRRLDNMKLCIPPSYNSVVKSYVRTYMVTNREKAKAIIGRTVMYFPIFEKYLAEEGMPEELKCVSVLESALIPTATSRSKAVGLWQFMAPTAKDYNLQINSTVDERRDPHRSTKAALTYLKRLHGKYGDWALALAAYNGGPGRVNKAIKRGRSKNFWKISKYLPKETRNYVPAFFAAAYLINYYQEHGIVGNYPDLDMQLTDVVKVYQTISFQEIANIVGIPAYTLETLNPSYKKKIIPTSYQGNYLILPQRVMGTFVQYLKYPDSKAPAAFASDGIVVNRHPNDNFFKTTYTVKDTDNIYNLASAFKCSIHNIIGWNNLSSKHVSPGQTLTMYQPIVSSDYQSEFFPAAIEHKVLPPPVRQKITTVPIASLPIEAVHNKPLPKRVRSLASLTEESHLYYRVLKGESLAQVAAKFPGVTLEDLLQLNDLAENKRRIKPGSRIKIKTF